MKTNVLTGQQLIIAGFVSNKRSESFAHLAHIYHQCIAVYSLMSMWPGLQPAPLVKFGFTDLTSSILTQI